MEAPAAHGTDDAAGVSRVEEALPCIGCGYDLRGTARTAACPECGVPLERSLDPRRLVFADRAWYAGVRRGLRRLAPATACVIVLLLFGRFFVGLLAERTSTIIAVLAAFAVVPIVTRPVFAHEPGTPPLAWWRRLEAACLAGPLLGFGVGVVGHHVDSPWFLVDVLAPAAALLLFAAFLVGLAAVAAQIGDLLERERVRGRPRLPGILAVLLRATWAVAAMGVVSILVGDLVAVDIVHDDGTLAMPWLAAVIAAAAAGVVGLVAGVIVMVHSWIVAQRLPERRADDAGDSEA